MWGDSRVSQTDICSWSRLPKIWVDVCLYTGGNLDVGVGVKRRESSSEWIGSGGGGGGAFWIFTAFCLAAFALRWASTALFVVTSMSVSFSVIAGGAGVCSGGLGGGDGVGPSQESLRGVSVSISLFSTMSTISFSSPAPLCSSPSSPQVSERARLRVFVGRLSSSANFWFWMRTEVRHPCARALGLSSMLRFPFSGLLPGGARFVSVPAGRLGVSIISGGPVTAD